MSYLLLNYEKLRQCIIDFSLIVFLSVFLLNCGAESDPQTVITPPTTDDEPVLEIKPPPQGVFHSANIIRSNSESDALIQPDIEGQDYISGTLVRIGWNLVNSSEGVFDFSAIERELAQAALYDSKINLAVVDSKETPQYILDKCETFTFTFRTEANQKTCLPWDNNYQRYKQELVTKLGEQFDNHANLSAIYFTYAAMTNGIEMHWRVDEAEYQAAGYTQQRLAQAYNDVMDMYGAAFPTTSVIMEIHDVFNSSNLAESAFEHCYDVLGSRCGVAIWWCASRMATDPQQIEFKVFHVAQQATALSFALCQTIGSITATPERFDQGQGWTSEEVLRFEMNFFISEGFKTFELWSNDLKNPSLMNIIQNEIYPRL